MSLTNPKEGSLKSKTKIRKREMEEQLTRGRLFQMVGCWSSLQPSEEMQIVDLLFTI